MPELDHQTFYSKWNCLAGFLESSWEPAMPSIGSHQGCSAVKLEAAVQCPCCSNRTTFPSKALGEKPSREKMPGGFPACPVRGLQEACPHRALKVQ